jgi:cyclopropane fatty-acyl-phospholipid synthase-like methyltransferase
MVASATKSRKPKITLLARIKAWWDGYELALVQKANAVAKALPHDVRADVHTWDSARVQLVQDVWGEGFSSPGNADYIIEMIKPFGLTPAMSVMEVGAGLGGASRLMAEHFGVWVTAFEVDHTFSDAGMELSNMSGMAKKAPVLPYDPENFEFKVMSCDCIYSKEAFFTVKKKNELLSVIGEALKDRGQFLFTDFVKAEKVSDPKALSAWIAAEPVKPELWSVKEYDIALSRLKIEIRITEDITDKFRAIVMKGWSNYLATATKAGISDQMTAVLVSEVELWARRVKAFESGDLRVCRIYGLKKQGSLLSDW